MARRYVIISAAAVAGLVGAVSIPLVSYAGQRRAEERAQRALAAVGEAQEAFRAGGGKGGYATDIASLTTPCAGAQEGALGGDRRAVVDAGQYRVTVRAAVRAVPTGTDCHGRPTASDFYASAEPHNPFAGRLGLAMTSHTRVYVFFDGIAPRESDMGIFGLAVPADTLNTFKIP